MIDVPEAMAALTYGNGSSWELVTVPVPAPTSGEVLVRVAAVATNNGDADQLEAAGEPGVAGYEFAGTVVALGSGVDRPAVGTRVAGTAPRAFAEYVTVDRRHLIDVPSSLPEAAVVALPVGLVTDYGAMLAGGFAPGRTVLVTGASSGMGLIGVQLAKALGASLVIGTTRSEAKRELVAGAGADVVVVGGAEVLAAAARGATDGRGVDLVLDHIGGAVLAECLAATADEGTIINIGRLAGAATIDVADLGRRRLRLQGVSFGSGRPDAMAVVFDALRERVLPAVADGRIRPVIDGVYPWERHDDAAARLRTRDVRGKVVIVF